MAKTLNATVITEAAFEAMTLARNTVLSLETDDIFSIVNDFLGVLGDAGLIEIDDVECDLEKLERGMYAASLYLSACAKAGYLEGMHQENIANLESCLNSGRKP